MISRVTVHGALAKEVVKQNPVLEFKIAPFLIDATSIIIAFNDDIDETPLDAAEVAKKHYPGIIRTILTTALDEPKVIVKKAFIISVCALLYNVYLISKIFSENVTFLLDVKSSVRSLQISITLDQMLSKLKSE